MKVSFKRDYKDVVVFQDKVTVVTLTGKVVMPEWSDQMPHEINTWISLHPSVDTDVHWIKDSFVMTIKASGKSKCHSEDTPNAIIGERIAESRAKIRLYRFMYTLTRKLLQHYFTTMYGNREVDMVRESHTEPPKDCVWLACRKYKSLLIKESHHLGKLMEDL